MNPDQPRRFLGVAAVIVLLLGGGGCTDPEPSSAPSDVETQTPITRIAFGSCNDQTASQPLWTPIRAATPDL